MSEKDLPDLNWIKTVFSCEENLTKTWKDWAWTSVRSGQELLEIVYGPYQEEFQKQALFLLLAPNTRLAPFPWQNNAPRHYLGVEVDFKKVEAGLRAYAVYWLTEFIDYTRFWPTDNTNQAILLNGYYKYILRLLEVVPAEDNQRELLLPYVSADKQIIQARQKVEEQEAINKKLLDAMRKPADIPPSENQSET